jgi:hypothetical protein
MKKAGFIHYAKAIAKEILYGNPGILESRAYYGQWQDSLAPGRNSVVDEQPWITFPVISILDKSITKASKVFEFGGGGSTLFFINRAAEVVTVEHDAEWYKILDQKLREKKISNWKGNLILPEPSAATGGLDPADPDHYFSADAGFSTNLFKAYASCIDQFPDHYFDVVLVDGRVRPSCTMHSVEKIKKGGLLVIDNSDRPYYFTKIQQILDSRFELVYNKKTLSPYVDFFTQTGVWRKK